MDRAFTTVTAESWPAVLREPLLRDSDRASASTDRAWRPAPARRGPSSTTNALPWATTWAVLDGLTDDHESALALAMSAINSPFRCR